NFEIASKKFVDYRGKIYDYASIMHYSRYQGNNRPGAVVLQPKKKNVEIGQRDGLSAGDIEQTKIMYKCNDNGESEFDYVPSPEDQEQGSASGDQKGPKPGDIEE
ncbi:nematocyst expressed protein 6, partial [Exaiptasia diaphana]|uniref:Peptidase M12A domain-containing protein n=1 Tax=Exaiptasia diaphana TaxID=2652724 RepID=A0A913YM66_EXADI